MVLDVVLDVVGDVVGCGSSVVWTTSSSVADVGDVVSGCGADVVGTTLSAGVVTSGSAGRTVVVEGAAVVGFVVGRGRFVLLVVGTLGDSDDGGSLPSISKSSSSDVVESDVISGLMVETTSSSGVVVVVISGSVFSSTITSGDVISLLTTVTATVVVGMSLQTQPSENKPRTQTGR